MARRRPMDVFNMKIGSGYEVNMFGHATIAHEKAATILALTRIPGI